MDVIGSSLREYILKENVELLRTNGIVPSKLSNGFVPVDIDVTPFDNSKTRKERVCPLFFGCPLLICFKLFAPSGFSL